MGMQHRTCTGAINCCIARVETQSNSHLRRHMQHVWFDWIHRSMQCMWKACLHLPHTERCSASRNALAHYHNSLMNLLSHSVVEAPHKDVTVTRAHATGDIPGGHSSPGALQSTQNASKGMRQIPQHSSDTSHFQCATALYLRRGQYVAPSGMGVCVLLELDPHLGPSPRTPHHTTHCKSLSTSTSTALSCILHVDRDVVLVG